MTPKSQHTPVAMLNVVGLVVAAAGITIPALRAKPGAVLAASGDDGLDATRPQEAAVLVAPVVALGVRLWGDAAAQRASNGCA
jgi:hypothetical protein